MAAVPIPVASVQNLTAKSLGDTSNKAVSVFRIPGVSDYDTGGNAFVVGSFGPNSRFDGVAVNIAGTWTHVYQWNNDTQRLLAFVTDTEAEVADNSTDLAAIPCLFLGVMS